MNKIDPIQLPEWNLADLYPGRESDELKRDLERMRSGADAFAARLSGKLASLDGDALAAAIREYEQWEELAGRVMSYAYLSYAENMADTDGARFFQNMQEQITEITAKLLFFTLELNRLEDGALKSLYSSSAALRHYRPWLERVRKMRPYQLSDELEKALHEKSVVGRAAWVRLFDETMASLQFSLEGETLGLEATLDRLSDKDRSRREAAYRALSEVFTGNLRLFVLITNTLAKDKEIEDGWRGFETPEQSRHLANDVEGEVVDALFTAVRGAYPQLSHRYYRLKARWMGLDKLEAWDRNAPLPEEGDRLIGWEEARRTVLDAYGRFSPVLASLGQRFFDNAWIDAPARPGKAPGAFAHPTVPSAHPYLLLNYLGKPRDVMTLAHELGHGVHQLLAAGQGALMADTPLTLAETASVFGEMLTFRALLDAAPDARRKRVLLAGKVEDMLNTVVRQIAFYDFERRLHRARRDGELPAEAIGEMWMQTQRESLGDAFRLEDSYASFWCYIPHFIHSPFYVYAYAFGDCLVNALYATYQQQPEGFEEKYLAMLEAGGTLGHRDLLAPFGLDAADPAFWQRGLSVIEGFIGELEALGTDG